LGIATIASPTVWKLDRQNFHLSLLSRIERERGVKESREREKFGEKKMPRGSLKLAYSCQHGDIRD